VDFVAGVLDFVFLHVDFDLKAVDFVDFDF